MNRLRGRSNTGEGGEDPARETPLPNGDSSECSAIKQVASGRFGVTSRYLTSAIEIQIKMAQGAKPGEGGHLPGKKVYPWIAEVRQLHARRRPHHPAAPPRHLLHRGPGRAHLRPQERQPRRARLGQALRPGGRGHHRHRRGQGRRRQDHHLRPQRRHRRGPARLHLPRRHPLRDRPGRDPADASAQRPAHPRRGGDRRQAHERPRRRHRRPAAAPRSLASPPCRSSPCGCLMQRDCQQDTCPAGIATQNCRLRGRFAGKPEHVVNFMTFVAQELREIMASLGFRTVDEMVGHPECLRQVEVAGQLEGQPRWTSPTCSPTGTCEFGRHIPGADGRHFLPSMAPDLPALARRCDATLFVPYTAERPRPPARPSASAPTSPTSTAAWARMLGSHGHATAIPRACPRAPSRWTATAAGGQSFGAFLPSRRDAQHLAATLTTTSARASPAASLTVRPPEAATFKFDENIVVGNVAFYGATSGQRIRERPGRPALCRAQLRRHRGGGGRAATTAAST